jgi:hypothetical protein
MDLHFPPALSNILDKFEIQLNWTSLEEAIIIT